MAHHREKLKQGVMQQLKAASEDEDVIPAAQTNILATIFLILESIDERIEQLIEAQSSNR